MIMIDDPDLEAMLRVIEATTGEPAAMVVRRALVRALGEPAVAPRVASPAEQVRRRTILLEARQAVARLPDLGPRSADEIIGYDEYGLPT